MSESLFDLETVRMDSPRLAAIKAADIQTHYAPQMPEPWMAIPMNAARKLLEGYANADELPDIPTITERFCRLLDDAGYCFFGATEREVQDAALDLVAKLNHKKP